MTTLPHMIPIRQSFPRPVIEDLSGTLQSELAKLKTIPALKRGARVAVTVGSRAIRDIDKVARAVCDYLKSMGTQPFIIPAMGSHGNATAEGQVRILAHLGVSEATMGVPICSGMEVVQGGVTEDGIPAYMDKNASEADAIVLISRIKPHTDFHGEIESGLMKMAAIGLGKQRGASECHTAATRYGLGHAVRTVARCSLAGGRIVAGIGLVENAYHELAVAACVLAAELEAREMELLESARRLMPRLPFDPIDLLIIDEIGKNISGTGMDPNITGRRMSGSLVEQGRPAVRRILVRDLTSGSDGNAVGIGLADFTTRRMVDKIDFAATYTNCLTAHSVANARLPIIFDTDEAAMVAAVADARPYQSPAARVVHIKNTLALDELYVSEAFASELQERKELSVLGPARAFRFDAAGCLKGLEDGGRGAGS